MANKLKSQRPMKIKLRTSMVGNRIIGGKVTGVFTHPDGAVIDWDNNEAKKMIERGYAEPVNDEPVNKATSNK